MFTKFDNVTGSDRRGKSSSKRLKLTDFAVRAFFLCHRKWDPFCNRFVLDKFGTNCQKNASSQQKNIIAHLHTRLSRVLTTEYRPSNDPGK